MISASVFRAQKRLQELRSGVKFLDASELSEIVSRYIVIYGF